MLVFCCRNTVKGSESQWKTQIAQRPAVDYCTLCWGGRGSRGTKVLCWNGLYSASSITVLFSCYFPAALNSNLLLRWEGQASVRVKLSYKLYCKFVKRRKPLWMKLVRFWGPGFVCVLLRVESSTVSVTLVMVPCIGGGGAKVTNMLEQLKKSWNITDTEMVGPQLCYLDRLILQRNGIIGCVSSLFDSGHHKGVVICKGGTNELQCYSQRHLGKKGNISWKGGQGCCKGEFPSAACSCCGPSQ